MNLNELQKALEEREFDTIKNIKVKKRVKNMLDYLSKNGVDIGAVIELGLEKIKIEKLVKDMEKQQNEAKKEEENRQNEEANNTVINEENDTVKNNTTTFNGGENR